MTRFEIRSTHQPLKLMRLAHSRTRLPHRLGEPGLFYQKFPRPLTLRSSEKTATGGTR
ncbi:MAG TPA: hypothetical protein VK477_00120 [Acidobacteriota bacterium]|nr:hypothetical protein [Acidobacteriota bacterium]